MMATLSLIVVTALAATVGYGSAALLVAAFWPGTSAPALPSFAERVDRELQNPDADLREALREVDRIGYHAPAVAVPEPPKALPPVPTLIGGNSVWRAPARAAAQMNGAANAGRQIGAAVQAQALANVGGALGGIAAGLANRTFRSLAQADHFMAEHDWAPWFWPYVETETATSSGVYFLRPQFGGARVSREWLEDHRHDIVQALRRL